MPTSITEFSYDLPPELIAQHSIEPRDHSRLMCLDRTTGHISQKKFYDILDELRSGDVLVFNDTKVFKARLTLQKGEGVVEEIFLLRCLMDNLSDQSVWQALVRPGKKIQTGEKMVVNGVTILVGTKHADGVVELTFPMSESGVLAFTDAYGSIPVPPYVSALPKDDRQYQTVYAREVGSVAAPTAGFHFTEDLLDRLKQKGVECAFVTLHVGIGTFRPVQTDTIEEHLMHAEHVTISKETAEHINRAKREGRRVIAVGTTTVRSLEGVANQTIATEEDGQKNVLPREGFAGDVNIFITPGFTFRVIDGLVTNFHLPKSTLLVLVSAFAGRDAVMHAYATAVQERYRFFSFGDAMFVR